MTTAGRTGPGRPAAVPDGFYTAPNGTQITADDTLVVVFYGEDGRVKPFPIGELPLPGWHPALAAAFAVRVGPSGGARTLASARNSWHVLQRFVRQVASLPDPPLTPQELRLEHVETYLRLQGTATTAQHRVTGIRTLVATLLLPPLDEAIPAAALAPLTRRRPNEYRPGKPGYSDRELGLLLDAARRDVVVTRDRLAAGESRLALQQGLADGTGSASPDPLVLMAATGVVPAAGVWPQTRQAGRRQVAEELFLTWPDMTSLLMLLVGVSGRNVETIKELPLEHRVLDGRAVELQLTKRRRGPRRWTETVTWEIGPAHRELHTPGGLYLLAHRLTNRGRTFSGATGLWSIWRNTESTRTGVGEHCNPFADGLQRNSPYHAQWTEDHDLAADQPDPAPGDGGDVAPRLGPDFIRLKTSIDVRHTRQMGGHLPSAARTNTAGVLFSSYLRDDPTTVDWARDVVGEALRDAEQAALSAHQRALRTAGGGAELATTTTSATVHGDRAVDNGWTSCADPDHHPRTGVRCRSTFLDCFHCPNALATPAHLPRLLALVDALEVRRQQMSDDDWWTRYGPVWASVRHDVLRKFTPTELSIARTLQPADALLDLVEDPWQHP